jgi:hypothetical protein
MTIWEAETVLERPLQFGNQYQIEARNALRVIADSRTLLNALYRNGYEPYDLPRNGALHFRAETCDAIQFLCELKEFTRNACTSDLDAVLASLEAN